MAFVTVPVQLWEPRLDVNDCIESWILKDPVNLRCSSSILQKVQRLKFHWKKYNSEMSTRTSFWFPPLCDEPVNWARHLPYERVLLFLIFSSQQCCSFPKTKAGQSATRMKGPTSVFLPLQLCWSLPFSLSHRIEV